MRTLGLPSGDVADIAELAPWSDELLLAVPTEAEPELLEDTVEAAGIEPVVAAVDPPLFPNTAMPVSSRRLRGGKGTVKDRLPPFAALVAAVLLAPVEGAHDAVVPAASTVPAPWVVAVPVVVPAWATAPPDVLTEVTLPLADVTPVLAAVTPPLVVAVWLAEDVPVPLADPADPWQAARPNETTTAGTTAR